jgi:HD-GYP domain-containing protein (c-di-GMP phosphodiesterase class II)
MSSEKQGLLDRISALRHRLETARGQAHDAANDAVSKLSEEETPGLARLWELERQTAVGADYRRQIDAVVRTAPGESPRSMPSQLTARARRVLERARELLHALREFQSEPLIHEPGGMLTTLYRETSALAEAGFRMVTSLPDSPAGQLQQCESIEALITSASQRLASLSQAIRQIREQAARLETLSDCLQRIESDVPADLSALMGMAGKLLYESAECVPLRFVQPPPPVADRAWVARMTAGHCLTTAQVMARLVRSDPELRGKAVEAVLAALLHDVGMLRISPKLLAHPEPLPDEGRRLIEGHCRQGAQILARAMPGSVWLVEAALHHHEHADGTGYPEGKNASQLASLSRLLAVCDAYAAGCQTRPHRPAREPRTSLTDTLLLAEQGKYDRRHAERLLLLGFYPMGSVVELADGAIAVVVATPAPMHDLQAPARPVVAVLTDAQGRFLPSPRFLDLTQSDSHSIVRSLSPSERQRTLGSWYPEWAL